jgi:hypothetical protein
MSLGVMLPIACLRLVRRITPAEIANLVTESVP